MEYEFPRPIKIDHIDRKGVREKIEANTDELSNLASRLNVVSVENLSASIQIEMQADKVTYHVTGTVNGAVTQDSVVSGEPVHTVIAQDIDAWFADRVRVASFEKEKQKRENTDTDDEYEIRDERDDPEVITDGVIDIGEVAVQFFALGIDDYPRTESETEGSGDYIEVTEDEAKPNPFAKLAELKIKE